MLESPKIRDQEPQLEKLETLFKEKEDVIEGLKKEVGELKLALKNGPSDDSEVKSLKNKIAEQNELIQELESKLQDTNMETLIKEKESTIENLKKIASESDDAEVKVLKEKIAEQNDLNQDLMRQLRDSVNHE